MKCPLAPAFDSVIAVLIIFAYRNLRSLNNRSLRFFGRHSFNIFLFHTFLFYLYFPEIIYWNRNPLVIFATLLTSCLVISVLLEYFKKAIKFNNIMGLIMRQAA